VRKIWGLLLGVGLATFLYVIYRHSYLIQSLRNLPRVGSVAELTTSDRELLAKITLPENFIISYFAKDVPGARSMTMGSNGIIYVGTRGENVIYALADKDHDGRADERTVVIDHLNTPNGVAYKDGDLYVAEISRVIKFSDIDRSYDKHPKYDVVYDDFPKDIDHGWKYIAIGPDNKIYVPVGVPCNICEPKDPYGSITRINTDGSGFEIYARGIRNTVGFDWNPETKDLWFTDNGRDLMGDDIPPDELNVAPDKGLHFGYPYCHAGDIVDPKFGRGKVCSNYASPAIKLGPHVAALGFKFYRGTSFPKEYSNRVFIAEHGSWNRREPIGYRITTVEIQGNKAENYQVFAEGWLSKSGDAWGRPVDILELKDGSILVSDDKAGAIYRISYQSI